MIGRMPWWGPLLIAGIVAAWCALWWWLCKELDK